jgi:membrane protein DedA with SNARE-associated domain
MSGLTQVAIDLISQSGYAGLGLGLFLDSFGPPIPSEVLIPLATILTLSGRFEPWAVFVVATVGQTLGATTAYLIGRYGGEPFVHRYGKYVLLTRHDLERTTKVFQKYGQWVTLVGRCVPGIRGVIGYPAGLARMPVKTFLIFTVLGSALWSLILMALGFWVGRNMQLMEDLAARFSVFGILLVLALLIWYFRDHVPQLRRLVKSWGKR